MTDSDKAATLATAASASDAGWTAGAEAMREVVNCKIAAAIGRVEEKIRATAADTHEYETKKALRNVSGALMNLQAEVATTPPPALPTTRPSGEGGGR